MHSLCLGSVTFGKWGLLARTTLDLCGRTVNKLKWKKNHSPVGAAAEKMLSKAWTAEPTGFDRLFLQSSHLLRRPLLFQMLNSSWAHQGQMTECRDDLNTVPTPGLLLLIISLPAAFPTSSFLGLCLRWDLSHQTCWFSLVLRLLLCASTQR